MRISAALMITICLFIAGCGSTTIKEVEDPTMGRVELAPVHTTPEIQAEVTELLNRLRACSETIYKDDPDGMSSNSINRLVAIGQPSVVALVGSYYDALDFYDQVHYRYLVLAVLNRMQEPTTQEFLVEVLRRGDRKERRLAAEALWRFGDNSVIGPLIAALDDESADVVNTVAAALRRITGTSHRLWRNLSDAQREEAIKRWRQWWALAGAAYR